MVQWSNGPIDTLAIIPLYLPITLPTHNRDI